jgi:transcriptional regulator with XRE-family HTH domain
MARVGSRSLQRDLGEKIQVLRHRRGLTQEALAGRCGITQKYLSELERGEKSPSWQTLVAIAHKGFDIKLASLLFGVDEDLGAEVKHLNDVLAGRSKEVRYDVLRAVELILRAAEASK